MMTSLERIQEMEEALAFGTLQITIKRHNSQTVAIDGQTLVSHKVDDNPGALAIIIAMLRAAEANQESGVLNCTIKLEQGSATRIVIEENRRTM